MVLKTAVMVTDRASQLYSLEVHCQPKLHALLNPVNTRPPHPHAPLLGYILRDLFSECYSVLWLIFMQHILVRD